ncbi:MAG: radical SAM protein [Deltaproteobacteria bacterium]|nr:MAG: radical SAM protein [Deltaproteobacteria bacterium]
MDLLDVVLDYDCNLKCSYCTITDEMRRRGLDARVVAAEIDRAARAGTRRLSITGGEPTIRPELLGLVRRARRRGFEEVVVQTNGLLFAHLPNVEKAVEAGVTTVKISVHGYDGRPASWEAVTGAEPGTGRLFEQAVANVGASPLRLEIDLILMRSTLATILPAMEALAPHGVDRFNLWLVSLTDRNAGNVAALPHLGTEVVPVLVQAFEWGRAQGIPVKSLHVPRCLLPGYEAHVEHPGAGQDVRVLTPDAAFQLSRSRLSGGHKPGRCRDCRYDALCPGLREDYVARYGDDEVQPVFPDAQPPARGP